MLEGQYEAPLLEINSSVIQKCSTLVPRVMSTVGEVVHVWRQGV